MNDDLMDWRRERLQAASDKAGGDAELGRMLGHKSGAQIGHMLLGRRPVTEKTIQKVEGLRGFAGWFGSTQLVQTAKQAASVNTPFLPGFEPLSIPLLANSGSMGPGSDQLHDEVVIGRLTVSPDWALRVVKPTKLEHLRFIHGYGDSMEPTFTDGDVLLVDLGVRDPKIDGVYVLEANDRIYIKRVRERLDGTLEISSDNPTVKTVDVLDGSTQVTVHGRVVWRWNGKKM
jgi:hypothetical protein